MALLITYILIALLFSFLCSIAEAVLLSVTTAYVAVLEKKKKPAGTLLHKLKSDINKPLSAILTLNTIAHTIGAAGAGAQVTKVFGNAYLGIASAILTLLILFLSEIIPKTLGAVHWRTLAPATAFCLKYLIILLYPFVLVTEKMIRRITGEETFTGLNRQEFLAMAELAAEGGHLSQRESAAMQNFLLLREIPARSAMTPRTVVFSVSEDLTVSDYFRLHEQVKFSRIPVYRGDPDHIEGFVLLSDLMSARASDGGQDLLKTHKRAISILPKTASLAQALNEILRTRTLIVLIVDEYGSPIGILTLEDIIEMILGLEIVDEVDKIINSREHARRLWKHRARKVRLDFREPDQKE